MRCKTAFHESKGYPSCMKPLPKEGAFCCLVLPNLPVTVYNVQATSVWKDNR
jgi:hypothetical protein